MEQKLMSSANGVTRKRDRQFDFLRIIFAILVLYSHAFEITDGGKGRELLSRLTRSGVTFGHLAVSGFFLLSGYLIVKSWQNNPIMGDFVRNRCLRILPGFIAAFLLSTLFVGLVAPAGRSSAFFSQLGKSYVTSLLLIDSPITPRVFPGLQAQVAAVNGSMWTISYEMRCYLLVAVCGLLRILRHRFLWLAATVVVLAATFIPARPLGGPWYYYVLTGDPFKAVNLLFPFLIGGCFYLFRDYHLYKPAIAAVALLGCALVAVFFPQHLEPGLSAFGGYLMFYFCRRLDPEFSGIPEFPDISYGLYLYGWPIESFIIWYFHRSPWLTFACSTVICIMLGWLSWNLIERPALRFKRRALAALPPT